jgi:hypothetical protein
MWDFVVDKVALGQVFSKYFGFPCQSSFHQLTQKSSSSTTGVCTIGQSGRSTRESVRPTNNNKKTLRKELMVSSD